MTQMQKPPRHRRAEISDEIRASIPVAKTYAIYAPGESNEQFNLFEKTIKNLRSFLWFLTKLDWTQFLHFMNDACLKPMRNEKLKPQATLSGQDLANDTVFSETALSAKKSSATKGKKRRFRRAKAG